MLRLASRLPRIDLPPPARWPLRWHAVLAAAVCGLAVAAAAAWHWQQQLRETAATSELHRAGRALHALRAAQQALTRSALLPVLSPYRLDDALADLGRIPAQALLHVVSMRVEHPARVAHQVGEPSKLRPVRVSMQLSGDYLALSQWLATLLAQHPALALQSLAIRAGTQTAGRIEATVSWVLHLGSPHPEMDAPSRAAVKAALRDPFAPAAATTPSGLPPLPPGPLQAVRSGPLPPLPPFAPEAPAQAAPPPAPAAAPALDVQFAGRMTAPDGSLIVLARTAGRTIQLQAGLVLANAWRVERLAADAVHFSYPPLNSSARLEIPAPPAFEIR